MIPMYNTKTFNEVYEDAAALLADYEQFQGESTINLVDDEYITLTWQLVSARFGNSHMANFSESQFRLRVWQTIFQYAPTWIKKLEVQGELRGKTLAQLQEGDKAIYNTALAPDSAISTEETAYINQQNVTKRTKSPLAAYNELLLLLETDVTGEYIDKFKKLFGFVASPNRTSIYVTEGDED